MSLLIPLGLLGLLSIVALIVIYIIKPNYQQKDVSSTHVWKLSLKYRKKRLPSGKLRNILLIVCQVLALVVGALIMAQPIIRDEKGTFDNEIFVIIDASASMRAKSDDETRFERAVEETIALSNRTVDRGGYVSVALSGGDGFILRKAGIAARDKINETLKELIEDKSNLGCLYGKDSIDDAIALCEEAIRYNPQAPVYLYTDTAYAYVPSGIEVVNVAKDGEWNAGILNARVEFEEGYYSVYVELGCYGGVSRTVSLEVVINGANEDKNIVTYAADVTLADDTEKTVIFKKESEGGDEEDIAAENIQVVPLDGKDSNSEPFSSFDEIHCYIRGNDCLDEDNHFAIYGGRKPQLKIQYTTPKRKTFFTGMLGVLRTYYADSWDVVWDEVELGVLDNVPATHGYNLYIFEDYLPDPMPRDGIVFLSHPAGMPKGIVERGERRSDQEMYLFQMENDFLTRNTEASKIFTRKYTSILRYDSETYHPLWGVETNPVLLLNDGEEEKVIISLIDIEYSNFGLRNDFAYLLFNIFEKYLPPTVSGNAFEVGEEITVNACGKSLTISQASSTQERIISALPAQIKLDKPDTYRFSQENWFGNPLAPTSVFVKIPSDESNISATKVTLRNLYREKVEEDTYQDLLVYLAAAMLALLFAEWFLQTQDVL